MADRREGRGADGAATTPGSGAGTTRADGLDARSDAERAGDHAAIGRLADELLPSLIAKLGASGLGELEVREGGWQVRLRGGGKSAGGAAAGARAAGAGAGRSRPGHEGHAHSPAAIEPRAHAGDGAASGGHAGDSGAVATSPAVGVFQPRTGVSAGTKVRAGDRIAVVEMLGIPQEVLAPADGIVGATLVTAGQAVEYGQELIRIELASAPKADAGADSAAGGSATPATPGAVA